jgi:dihydroneopterin aldolase
VIYKVRIDGLKVFAYHGVLQQEKDFGHEFYIDAHLDVEAGQQDRIESTVSYSTVSDELVKVATTNRFDLIETLAARLKDHTLGLDPRIIRATITVHKPLAPIGHKVRDISVSVSGARSEY